jgi:hypothetical protein
MIYRAPPGQTSWTELHLLPASWIAKLSRSAEKCEGDQLLPPRQEVPYLGILFAQNP